MWVSLILLGLFVLAAVAGATGRGVYDSRDPAYSLHLPTAAPPADEATERSAEPIDVARARPPSPRPPPESRR